MKKVDDGFIRQGWKMTMTALLFGVLFLGFQSSGVAQEDCPGGICNDAFEVVDGTNHTPIMNCGDGATVTGDNARWFVWTAPADGVVDISSCEPVNTTNEDTQLYLYTGSCEDMTLVNSSADECYGGGGTYQWAARLTEEPVDSGVTYFIEWNDRYEETAFDWTFNFVPDPECDVATVTSFITDDCETGTFNVTIDIADDGDATGYDVSYSTDGGETFVSAGTHSGGSTGIMVGSFSFGDEVEVAVAHNDDSACDQLLEVIASSGEACPVVGCGPDTYSYCYGDNDNTFFGYQAAEGTDLYLTINSGSLENSYDFVYVYDGLETTANILFEGTGTLPIGEVIHSTTGQIMVHFESDGITSCEFPDAWGGETYETVEYTISCSPAPGCTDPEALNFDPNALDDDGSCIISGCTDAPVNFTYCYVNYDDAQFLFGAANEGDMPIISINSGFTESSYDFLTIYDGLTTDAPVLYDDSGDHSGTIVVSTSGYLLVVVDSDVSGNCAGSGYDELDWDIYCGVAMIPGCTDPQAVNYNPDATQEDDSCEYPLVSCGDDEYEYCYGNNEDTRFYYQAESGTDLYLRIDAGQMENCCDYFEVYNGFSTGSTLLFSGNGMLPVNELLHSATGEIMVRITSDGGVSCSSSGYIPIGYTISCESPAISGCTDPEAVNYNPDATEDDGSCIVGACDNPQVLNYCYGNNSSDFLVFSANEEGDIPMIYILSGAMEACCDDITIYDGENTGAPVLFGPQGGDLSGVTVTSTSGYLMVVFSSDSGVSCESGSAAYAGGIDIAVFCGSAVIEGCTDPEATNYNPDATDDDGSCVFPPVNDECADAIELPVNADEQCEAFTSGTIAGASASEDDNPCGGTADDDVWYTFTATATAHIIELFNTTGSTTDLYHSVYSGNCGELVNLSCSDADVSLVGGLTPGETYTLRVYTWTSTAGQTTSFDVCVGTPPAPPANDDCTTPVTVDVNEDFNCTSVTSGTLAWATESPEGDDCYGTPNNDVWFEFTATAAMHTIDLLNVAPYTDMYHAVYSGICGELVNISCSDLNDSDLSDLTVGETYLIQVYSYGPGVVNTTFDICVGTYPPPPANDDCATPFDVVVNEDLECGLVTSGTLASATGSEVENPCYGTDNNDVWFSFTATATSHTIDLLNVSPYTDMYHAVYAQGCGSLVNVGCSDDNDSVVEDLTIGESYLIQVYSYYSSEVITTFDVCVGTMPPPPANDLCADAIPVACGETFIGNTSSASNADAPETCTTSLNTAPGVWHVVEGFDGLMEASLCNSSFDTKIGIFSGTCGELVCVVGNDDDTGTDGAGLCEGGNVSSVSWMGSEEETYYIYVTGYSANAGAYELLVECSPVTGIDSHDGGAATATLFPNPNAGSEVRVSLDGLSEGNHDVNIVIYDIYGKMISTEAFGHEGTQLSRLVRFDGNLSTGMYMVQILVDGEQFATERLIVQ